MKKLIIFFLLFFSFFFISKNTFAYDPSSLPNNKFGIHVLNPLEIEDAAKLVNSTGGDWGYITVPIQAGDKDLRKWQNFMDKAKQDHIIPILRLATEGDFFNTKVWRKPEYSDVLDFSNFLASLDWPTKNRYVIIFNEVNRADEWGGKLDPTDYAKLLSYAVSVFKSKSGDFFIISSGMDNAASGYNGDMNEYDYFSAMENGVPGIFNQIDGISSHSYPNPGFILPSSYLTTKSIDTYYYEDRFLNSLSNKKLPIFITETGWDSEKLPIDRISYYFQDAFRNVWNDPSVIAVTPFLLNAGTGAFEKFSFMDKNGNPNQIYKTYQSIQKLAGAPILSNNRAVLSATFSRNLPIRNFNKSGSKPISKMHQVEDVVKTLLKLSVL